MTEFRKENLENIKNIFEEKTGVELPERRRAHRPVKIALVLAALIACLSVTTFAGVRFSALQGDDLALGAVYEGGGVVAITVENRSDKLLEFEPNFYLRRWKSGAVAVDMEKVKFENLAFEPHSKGIMRIDLSEACDVAALEEPLEYGDWHYFLLTNDRFIFGQDWMCSVNFSDVKSGEPPIEDFPDDHHVAPSSSEESRKNIEESLRPHFENISIGIMERRQQAYDYIAAYTELLESFEGEIVESVSPCLPGNRVDITQPLFSIQPPDIYAESTFNTWTGVDADYRFIATESEYAYVVEAILPANGGYTETVPMIFILSYEQEAIRDDAYAFIHGRLLTFAELEPYKVYEGEGKVSYEISRLIFDDPAEYVRACDAQDGDSDLSESAVETFADMYEYYTEHLSELACYRSVE